MINTPGNKTPVIFLPFYRVFSCIVRTPRILSRPHVWTGVKRAEKWHKQRNIIRARNKPKMYIPFIDLVTCQFCVLTCPAYIVPSDIVNAVFDPVQAVKQIFIIRTGCRLYSLPRCPVRCTRPGPIYPPPVRPCRPCHGPGPVNNATPTSLIYSPTGSIAF